MSALLTEVVPGGGVPGPVGARVPTALGALRDEAVQAGGDRQLRVASR